MPIKPNNSDNSRSTALSASHTDHTHTHAATTGQTSDQHHAKAHAADHAENAADEIVAEGLGATSTDVSTNLKPDGTGGVEFVDSDHADLANVTSDQHHAQAHTAASHSDQGATGAELEDLTDSGATTLHKHDHGGQDGLADDDHSAYPAYTEWASWSPSWTNVSVGNGTEVAQYTQIGKTVHFYISLIFGSTTSVTGTIIVSSPVTASSGRTPFTAYNNVGLCVLRDDGAGSNLQGAVTMSTADLFRPRRYGVSGTDISQGTVNATVPFTWATSDVLIMMGTYEAATAV